MKVPYIYSSSAVHVRKFDAMAKLKDIVHYELSHGRVLCMLNEPVVSDDKGKVTCKKCLNKLKMPTRLREIPKRKTSVRHLKPGKNTVEEVTIMNIGELRQLINETYSNLCEAFEGDDLYLTQDDAIDMISNIDGDEVTDQNIIDEETFEVYLKAGQSFHESPWSPDHKLDARKAEKDEEYANRAGAGQSYWSKESLDEPEDDDEWATSQHNAADTLNKLAKEYAENWTHFRAENSDLDPDAAAPDAAEGFFDQYPDWKEWARALGMSKFDVKSYVADEVYEAMLTGKASI